MNRPALVPGLSLIASLLVCVPGCGPAPAGDDFQPGADVEVLVDGLGVPHIYAETDADAAFASGYVMASMRLFQMDQVRRRATGTLAEVLGGPAMRDDVAARTFDFLGWGHRSRERMEQERPAGARVISAFVAGVNRYVRRVREGEA